MTILVYNLFKKMLAIKTLRKFYAKLQRRWDREIRICRVELYTQSINHVPTMVLLTHDRAVQIGLYTAAARIHECGAVFSRKRIYILHKKNP